MSSLHIRKIVILQEETHEHMHQSISPPARKIVVAAVMRNPYAGQFVQDLEPLYDLGAEVGGLLAERGVSVLAVEPDAVEAYGKAAIVGLGGEIEHAAALLHPRFGAPVRRAVHKGEDIIPSTKKMGGPGAAITMPITNKNSIWSFDHMDAAEISIPDAPRDDEIVVAVALAVGGRPLHRIKPD